MTRLPASRRIFRPVLGVASVILGLGLGAAALPALAAVTHAGKGVWNFVSAPHLHPPKLRVLERRSGLAPGDFLAASSSEVRRGESRGQVGPMILDSHARPVWFMNAGTPVEEFQQETYHGKPVLVLGEPQRFAVLNEHYRTVASVTTRSPWTMDPHDASIIGGDIWVTVIRAVAKNLSAYGGPAHGTVIDCGVQEYRLSDGQLLRTWDALNPGGRPNVPLSASEASPSARGGWDAYHLNAVQALPNGDLLLSFRDTWAVYLIDPSTGKTLWTLGGKRSTFTFGKGAHFALQHDAKLVRPGNGGTGPSVELTLFNDNSGGHASEGMVLRLDTTTDKASLVAAYHHRPPLHAGVEGSMELLSNGNALVGWGSAPYFSEYSASGRQLLNVKWPGRNGSYRALFTDTWVGTPYYRPRGAVRDKTVYASWNGATQVAKWQVLAGSKTHDLKVLATHRRTGFETAIPLGKTHRVYKVRALNADGRTLGTSKAFS